MAGEIIICFFAEYSLSHEFYGRDICIFISGIKSTELRFYIESCVSNCSPLKLGSSRLNTYIVLSLIFLRVTPPYE